MLTRIRRRYEAHRGTEVEAAESGFTLIELMVVVLIIAILMAIAIPTFLGSKNSAQNNAAQQDISNVIVDAASLYANTQTYFGICGAAGTLSKTETNLKIQAAGTAAPLATANKVTAACPAAQAADEAMLLTSQSATGDCWMAWVDTVSGTQYGVDTSSKGTAAACPAADVPATSTAGAAPTPAAGGNISWATSWSGLTG